MLVDGMSCVIVRLDIAAVRYVGRYIPMEMDEAAHVRSTNVCLLSEPDGLLQYASNQISNPTVI